MYRIQCSKRSQSNCCETAVSRLPHTLPVLQTQVKYTDTALTGDRKECSCTLNAQFFQICFAVLLGTELEVMNMASLLIILDTILLEAQFEPENTLLYIRDERKNVFIFSFHHVIESANCSTLFRNLDITPENHLHQQHQKGYILNFGIS